MVEDLLDDEGLLDLRTRATTRPAAGAGTPPPLAQVAGLCALCGAKPARSACRACGRSVCTADTWAMLGVCKDCARGRT